MLLQSSLLKEKLDSKAVEPDPTQPSVSMPLPTMIMHLVTRDYKWLSSDQSSRQSINKVFTRTAVNQQAT